MDLRFSQRSPQQEASVQGQVHHAWAALEAVVRAACCARAPTGDVAGTPLSTRGACVRPTPTPSVNPKARGLAAPGRALGRTKEASGHLLPPLSQARGPQVRGQKGSAGREAEGRPAGKSRCAPSFARGPVLRPDCVAPRAAALQAARPGSRRLPGRREGPVSRRLPGRRESRVSRRPHS